MLKRNAKYSFHFLRALFVIIMLSSCAAKKEQELAEKRKQQNLLLSQGPSWQLFEESYKKFCDERYHDKFNLREKDKNAKVNIAWMLFAKTDLFANPEKETGLDNTVIFWKQRWPHYSKWLEKLYADEKNDDGFLHKLYKTIAEHATHVSTEDVCQIIMLHPKYPRFNLDEWDYSKAFAKALLQAYESTEYWRFGHSVYKRDNTDPSRRWAERMRNVNRYGMPRAACILGDIAKLEEFFNRRSSLEKGEYFGLMLVACRYNNPDVIKFLLPAFDDAKDYWNDTEFVKLPTAAAALPDSRCLSLLSERYSFSPDILIAAIQSAVKANSTENVFLLTKKFATPDNILNKNKPFIDCSTPLIKGNTAILQELKRAGFQISLDSLPAIIADNGPTVLSSIDSVMEGKTPLLLASQADKMDKAMLAAAAAGNADVLKKLVQYGCEVNCMDENEKSPLAIAKEKNHRDCIAYLESVNAVSSRFQLRLLRSKIEKKRKELVAKIKIKQYQDELFQRQAQMLRELSGTDKILVETLLKAKIFWKGVFTLPLSFAKAKVFKTENHNSFNILIYPELSPECKKYVEDLFTNGGVNSADGMHIAGVIQNIESASQNGKYITVLLEGDMIKIIKTSPEISVGF